MIVSILHGMVTSASEVKSLCMYSRSDRAGCSQYWEWVVSVAIATQTIPRNRKWVGSSGGPLVALPSSLLTYMVTNIARQLVTLYLDSVSTYQFTPDCVFSGS